MRTMMASLNVAWPYAQGMDAPPKPAMPGRGLSEVSE